jgi:hypothetical protein
MGKGIQRSGYLTRAFKSGNSELLNEIAALCILYEDFRFEVMQLRASIPSALGRRTQHPALYFIRRSLVTLYEYRRRLNAICRNAEFRSQKHLRSDFNNEAIEQAWKYLNRNDVLREFRNWMGAHIDPEIVKSALQNFHSSIVSSVSWQEGTDDFAVQLPFATDILSGGFAYCLGVDMETLDAKVQEFLQLLVKAYEHVLRATLSLVLEYVWNEFGK